MVNVTIISKYTWKHVVSVVTISGSIVLCVYQFYLINICTRKLVKMNIKQTFLKKFQTIIQNASARNFPAFVHLCFVSNIFPAYK